MECLPCAGVAVNIHLLMGTGNQSAALRGRTLQQSEYYFLFEYTEQFSPPNVKHFSLLEVYRHTLNTLVTMRTQSRTLPPHYGTDLIKILRL